MILRYFYDPSILRLTLNLQVIIMVILKCGGIKVSLGFKGRCALIFNF